MRQRVVLIAGLLILAGCGAAPSTESHTVSFELETVSPVAYTDIDAEYSLLPLAHETAKKYDKAWARDVVVHYPDVERVTVSGTTELKDDVLVPDPGATSAKLRCRISVDGVLVAQNVGEEVTCGYTMTAGRPASLRTKS